MQLHESITVVINNGEQGGYVAECREISVVTQGKTLDDVVMNLREAVSLHLEGENAAEFGLVDKPSLIITFELQPEYA